VKIVIDMNLSPEWETVFAVDYEIKHWSKIGQADALVKNRTSRRSGRIYSQLGKAERLRNSDE
jgi:predicted nuclease of predicted toxin-antitoxin system